MGNWNVTSLNGKEQELVWEAEQYHLDIVGVSSTKCCGSDTVELNEGWRLFYSGVDVTMSSQAGVGIFVSPCLAHCVTDWTSLGGRVCLLKLRLQEQSLCILQVYAPNTEAQYQPFLDEISVALQKVTSAESIVLLGDFNAHVGTDNKTWKNVIKRQEDFDINRNRRCLLQFCATNKLCIMNTFFRHKGIHKYTWYKDSVGQCSIIDFCIVSVDLLSSVVNVCVKRRAELSTNHYLVICILRGLNHSRTRKRFRARRVYRIKWELLANKKVRHTFASKVASLFRVLPEYTKDVETEWDLFKSAVIISAASSCGCKRVEDQMGSKKRTAWWNQEVKEAIRAKKTAFRSWLTNKSPEQPRLRYSTARKIAATIVKRLKKSHGKNLDKSWIQTTNRQTKYFGNHTPFAW